MEKEKYFVYNNEDIKEMQKNPRTYQSNILKYGFNMPSYYSDRIKVIEQRIEILQNIKENIYKINALLELNHNKNDSDT